MDTQPTPDDLDDLGDHADVDRNDLDLDDIDDRARARVRVGRALIPSQDPDVELVDVTPSGRSVPVDTRDYVRFDPDRAVRVRVLAGDTISLDLWCVEPQQSTGVMQCPDSDVIYTVVGGRSWFVTEEGDVGLDPLGALWVPAGTVHGIDNRGADPLIVSMTMAPPDPLAEADADGPGEAIRDDSAHEGLGVRLRRGFGRILGDR